MTTSKTINATAASLLGFLQEKPMTGWDLAKYADERIGTFWNLTKSQVYREIQSLIDLGYIVSSERGQRDKRLLTITDQGRRIFASWLRETPGQEIIRFPLLLAASFADQLDPGTLKDFIDEHRPSHEARLKQYEISLESFLENPQQNKGVIATYSFGIKYEESVLEWMDDMTKTLTKRISTTSA